MKTLFLCVVLFLSISSSVSLPTCSTTTCTRQSDCPVFTEFGYVAQCINGQCVNGYVAPTMELGQSCNTSAGLLCKAGTCSSSQRCETLISNGCSCTSNSQCEGALCLNGVCDSIRSVGDECSSDQQCGSVCRDGKCVLGSTNDKCNSHSSCSSNYCSVPGFTCQPETRPACSAGSPQGFCPVGSSCYSGQCLSHSKDEGASCDSSIVAPQCKISLACVNNVCRRVAEGTACSDHSMCAPIQECMCPGATGQLGCYTKMGYACASLYQALVDCQSACTEVASVYTPNTCASKCVDKKEAFECCVGCGRDGHVTVGNNLLNVKGVCPLNIEKVQCCSSTQLCGANSANETCAVYLPPIATSDASITLTSGLVILFALFTSF